MSEDLKSQSWSAFRRGEILEAKTLAVQAIEIDGAPPSATAYPSTCILEGLKFSLQGSKAESFDKYDHVLGLEPENQMARLLLHEDLKKEVNTRPRRKEGSGKIVFGLGTGRMGSTSIAGQLGKIDNAFVSHEHYPIVRWKEDFNTVAWHLERMSLLADLFGLVADISHWWLPYAERIIEHLENSSFLCVRRSKQETVDSFLKIKGGGGQGSINHWVDHDGTFFQLNSWDATYPSYSAFELSECLEKYWDEYYETASSLQKRFPDRFLLVDFEEMKSPLGREKVAEFLGLSGQLSSPLPAMNVGSTGDSANFSVNPYVR